MGLPFFSLKDLTGQQHKSFRESFSSSTLAADGVRTGATPLLLLLLLGIGASQERTS